MKNWYKERLLHIYIKDCMFQNIIFIYLLLIKEYWQHDSFILLEIIYKNKCLIGYLCQIEYEYRNIISK